MVARRRSSGNDDDPLQDLLERAKPLIPKISFGSVLGYCSGTAAKKIGKAIAITVGIMYMAVQSAAYSGYLKVDWDKVEKDVVQHIDVDGDGKFTEKDLQVYWGKIKRILTYNIPSASGFTIGFLYGLKC